KDALELVAKERNLIGGLGVCLRREQPQEATFSRDAPGIVQLLHADVVHAGAPMHGGFRIRLADDEHRAAQDPLAQFPGDGIQPDRLRPGRTRLPAKDSQNAAALDLQRGLLSLTPDRVLAITEQDEVPLPDPAQELLYLAKLSRSCRQAATGATHHLHGVP